MPEPQKIASLKCVPKTIANKVATTAVSTAAASSAAASTSNAVTVTDNAAANPNAASVFPGGKSASEMLKFLEEGGRMRDLPRS